jgi:tetratricopeptide (TPR) repeat protein
MTKRLTHDQARALIPDLEELRPLLEAALRSSVPDPDRAWSESGELETVGARLIDGEDVRSRASELAEHMARRTREVYEHVGTALTRAEVGDMAGAAEALLLGAAAEERAGRFAQAAAMAAAASRALQVDPDRPQAALAIRRWARAARSDGRLEEALRLYARAREIAAATNDAPGRAEAAIGGGNVLEQLGRWDAAEAWYREALSALDDLTPPSAAHWHAPLNLHIVVRSVGRIDASRSWLERAEAASQRVGDASARCFLENARGQLLMADDDPQGAERAFHSALSAVTTSFAAVTVRLNLAESLLRLGRALDAAEHARVAERDAIAGAALKLPEVYRLLGRIAGASGSPHAFVLFERSLELAGRDEGPMLERAMTLQAYAQAESDPEVSSELGERALAAYRQTGIRRARRRWVDCFDGTPTGLPEGPPANEEYDA